MVSRRGIFFLNHGSYGAVPVPVRERQKELLDLMNENPDRFYKIVEGRLYDEARRAASAFLGAKAENLVFVPNATTGVNTVLRSLPWDDGDEILGTNFTFTSNVNACRSVADSINGKFHQFQIRFPIKDSSEIVKSMTSYLDNFQKIRLVVLDHISSPTTVVFPVKEMIAECRKRHVLTLVDGAHAIGQVEVNLEDLRPDFYTGNFHKWLYTPRGCAILWVAEEHQKWCAPLLISLQYKKGYQKEFKIQGTRDNIPYLVVPEVLKFFEDIGGLEKIHCYADTLLDSACQMLWNRLGARPVEVPESMKAPNMRLIHLPRFKGYTINFEGARKLNLDIMEKHKVVCLICAVQGQFFLRLSANVYNELSDFVKLVDALSQINWKDSIHTNPVSHKCKL